jgi:cytochrome c oxidase cbb3-type subunit 4
MDYGTFRGVLTIIMMVVFLGIVWWAYSKKTKSRFNEAANLVFADEDTETKNNNQE